MSLASAVLEAVDRMDDEAFADFFVADGSFRFGNQKPVVGKAAIQSTVAQFFQVLEGIAHTDLTSWVIDDVVIINGQVTYTRLNGTGLTVPFAITLTIQDGLIKSYFIFVDNSELFAA